MKNIVTIDGKDYSLWISETPEHFLKRLDDGYYSLEGSKSFGYISEDIYLSKSNLGRIIRKPFSSKLIHFNINEGYLSTKSSFEVDLDESGASFESLSELFNSDEYESTGSCDNCYYFNFLEKDKILEEKDRFIETENHFYIKYIFTGCSDGDRRAIIKTTRDYFDELKEDVKLTEEINKVWKKDL